LEYTEEGTPIEGELTWSDVLVESPENPGVEAYFSNVADSQSLSKPMENYIDFTWNGTSMTNTPYQYPYIETRPDLMCSFIGCVLPTEGEYDGYIGYVAEFDVTLNTSTGELIFPAELTHAELGTWPAVYVIYAFDSTGKGAGYWSPYMSNLQATKTGAAAPAGAGELITIKMGGNIPAGFSSELVRADMKFVR
jgi:hypothetical protein